MTQYPRLERFEANAANISEPLFGLLLSLDQRVAGHEIVSVQLTARVSRVTDFTEPAGQVKTTKQELAPVADMLSPGYDETEGLEGPGLKAL